jgi:hypothetical protein
MNKMWDLNFDKLKIKEGYNSLITTRSCINYRTNEMYKH